MIHVEVIIFKSFEFRILNIYVIICGIHKVIIFIMYYISILPIVFLHLTQVGNFKASQNCLNLSLIWTNFFCVIDHMSEDVRLEAERLTRLIIRHARMSRGRKTSTPFSYNLWINKMCLNLTRKKYFVKLKFSPIFHEIFLQVTCLAVIIKTECVCENFSWKCFHLKSYAGDTNIQVLLLLIATFKVIIQGADGILRLATPEEHEAWCPFGIQIEMIRLETQSRKSSATNLSRKSSCKPLDRL